MVACPRCGATTAWNPANAFRPFCSARCKMIDLGQWASDGYRIPVQDADAGDREEDRDNKT